MDVAREEIDLRAVEDFNPDYKDGHDQGACYWIMPVKEFFFNRINPLLPINRNRYSTDDVIEGIPIFGFKWYLYHNFYSHESCFFKSSGVQI